MTIETLETMFVYLGCANIETQEAMDGAIPLESAANAVRDAGESVARFKPSAIEEMNPSWSTKAVWFSGDHLGLSTVENVHWSEMSRIFEPVVKSYRIAGLCGRVAATGQSDGFVKLYYSEIDKYGRFVKFPIRRKVVGEAVVKKLYNPSWLFEFRCSEMRCLRSDSDEAYRSKRIEFLTPFLCGVAQSLGSYWLVKTRFDAVCPSLTLLTDPLGVKEFWKLRDIPAGKKRRVALLHWVEQHWRQTRNDPDVELFVRKHLRGASEMTLGQFKAEITPSRNDSVAVEIAKEGRELMRKAREDRRRRAKRLARN
jgi:hypothetical protein